MKLGTIPFTLAILLLAGPALAGDRVVAQIITDATPVSEFQGIRTTLTYPGGAKAVMDHLADPGIDYGAGVRVAEWSDLPDGTYRAEISLIWNGVPTVTRPFASFSVEDPDNTHVLTALLTVGGTCEVDEECGIGQRCDAGSCGFAPTCEAQESCCGDLEECMTALDECLPEVDYLIDVVTDLEFENATLAAANDGLVGEIGELEIELGTVAQLFDQALIEVATLGDRVEGLMSDNAALSQQLSALVDDSDDDGVPALRDDCPDTVGGDAVDTLGCSVAQFCGAQPVGGRLWRVGCARADWGNDEPVGAPRDCVPRWWSCAVR